KKLELVHYDVWGPASTPLLGGSLYYVTFIDDATRKTWVYVMKNKSDVFFIFQRWKAIVEYETGTKVKCLRSDNGGEYCSQAFESFCTSNGIQRQRTTPRTPQQNGISERMNSTIMERARSMRLHASLLLELWAEAVSTSVYLINRSPSTALDGGVPEEAWTDKPVNYAFLKVFGWEAFMHIDRSLRSKLDTKSKKCFFIGYGEGDFGYRLWNPEDSNIPLSPMMLCETTSFASSSGSGLLVWKRPCLRWICRTHPPKHTHTLLPLLSPPSFSAVNIQTLSILQLTKKSSNRKLGAPSFRMHLDTI
ncbi:hypothetical protein GOP47_0029675, partial [Adiantum capillus-veneris]